MRFAMFMYPGIQDKDWEPTVEVVEATFFPRTALGKVQKVALAERLGWRHPRSSP